MIHLQVKTQADLDTKMALLDAHLKAATEAPKRTSKYLLVFHHA